MAGVAVWSYKNNRNFWSIYEPDVCCHLERLYALGTQQKVNLGNISPHLACYDVSFVAMTQTTVASGSTREIKRTIHDSSSALGQGAVWEFEGDLPSQWVLYDLETLELIEKGFQKRNQMNSTHLDLRQAHLYQPYIIDFVRMTQMRIETGTVRRIQRRSLAQAFPPAMQASGATSSTLPSSSSAYPLSNGAANWLPQQHKIQTAKKKIRSAPYLVKKSGSSLDGHGIFHGSNVQVPLATSQVSQQSVQHPVQQPQPVQQQHPVQQSQPNTGPVTRRMIQQATGGGGSAAALYQHVQPQRISLQQMCQSSQFYLQTLQNMHISGAYNHMPSLVSGSLGGFQYSTPQLNQSYSIPALPSLPSSLVHQQTTRSSAVNSHASESLPSVTKVTIGKSKKTKSGRSGPQVLESYVHTIHTDLDNDCSICFSKLSEASSYGEDQPEAHVAVELNKCGHRFHKLCLQEMHRSIHKDESLQCPSCKTIYGEKTGNCPPGYMQWKLVHGLTLTGYDGYGTILVSYHIAPGIQGPEHPNPGQNFSARGFPRQGYLPDCDKGRKVLKLLMEAFRRRLMFTIATSHTTGETNTVTWNEIHHKTEPHGNATGHGYPDPNYLDNVLMELAAHGVSEEALA